MDVPTRGNVLGRVVPARYILAVLGSIAMAIVYGLKVNLSVAMVGMLNHTAIRLHAVGGTDNGTQTHSSGELECEPTSSGKNATVSFKGGSRICFWEGYILAVLGSIAMAIVYGLKVNLSVAMVGMLNHTAIRLHAVGGTDNGTQTHSSGELECEPTSSGKNATVSFKGGSRICFWEGYILAVLGSIAMAIVYGLKVNLSVAMVGMLNHTAIRLHAVGGTDNSSQTHSSGELECEPTSSGKNATELIGPFDWSSEIQGIILSCYFWGYFVSQIPGARVAELFSAKWVMFFSVTINVVCTLLTPVMAELHYVAVIFMRIGEGIGGGVTFPAMHVLLSKWAPPAERSVMAALVYAGTSLGTVISMLMAGGLTVALGWESVFYVMGGLSCIWCVLWVLLVQDSPQQQPLISAEERTMIVTSLGGKADDHGHKKLPVPWKAVLTSPPFLAILVSHACSNWGWYMLLIELPFYMKQVLKFNMTENAVTTALPFLSLWIFSMGLSRTLDWMRGKSYITTTTARKIGTLFASVVPAICLLALCYIGCNRSAAVALMAIGITCIGGMFCGFLSNHIDIAPNFAGTLMAMTNTVATIPGIVVPIFVGVLTNGNQTISAWRVIFFVTIGLYIIEIIAFTTFGSGEQQPWNNVPEDKAEEHFETKPLNNDEKEKANV